MDLFRCAPWESNTTAESLCQDFLKKTSRKRGKLNKEKVIKPNKNKLKQVIDKELNKRKSLNSNTILNAEKKHKTNAKRPKLKNTILDPNNIPDSLKKTNKQQRNLDTNYKKKQNKQNKNYVTSDGNKQLTNSIHEVKASMKSRKYKKKHKIKIDKLNEDIIHRHSNNESNSKIINKKKRKDLKKEHSSLLPDPSIVTKTIVGEDIWKIGEEKKRTSLYSNNRNTIETSTTKLKKKIMQHGTNCFSDDFQNEKNETKPKKNIKKVRPEVQTLQNQQHTKLPLKLKKKMKHLEKLKHSLTAAQNTAALPEIPQSKIKPILNLRQKMMQKLKAARFRYLNEQIYKTTSREAVKIFKTDPDAFEAYHEGYRQQVKRWPFNPLDTIIKTVKNMPKTHIIADFGCGDSRLAKSVEQKVHSFDLVATSDLVTACDMAHVPLEDSSVDVVVFCLSLMGTNLCDYLLEANRVLKIGGLLKIAEIESRFENVEEFIEKVTHFGFKKIWKDLSRNLFYFMDFKKEHNVKNKNKLPVLSLLPCLYKKR